MDRPTLLDGSTYSRSEVVRHLEARGLTVPKERTLLDWAERGLLDRSTVHPGAGRGKGSKEGRRPGTQVELLALLITKREEVGTRRGAIGLLANIPVFLWLGWGEDYVPLRQVRRALGTWANQYQRHRGEWERTDQETRQVARLLRGPGARQSDATALASELAKLSVSKQLDVTEDLLDLGDRVIDPGSIGREFGAPGASVNAEKLLAMVIALQWGSEKAAADRLKDLNGGTSFHFTDADYRRVRSHWQATSREYGLMQPLLRAAGPADMYEPLTAEMQANTACRAVLNLLALTDPRLPRTWLRQDGSARSPNARLKS